MLDVKRLESLKFPSYAGFMAFLAYTTHFKSPNISAGFKSGL